MSRSTRPWSRSRDGRHRRGSGAVGGLRGRQAGARPIDLTEAALEALLFVAERPLSRREIATLAGSDRATVDARLGDLEVSLRERGIRLLIDGDRVELATAPEGGALVARYVGRRCRPAVAGLARDAGDRGLSPARDQGGHRSDPRRRLGLHDPNPAPSTADRRARPVGRAGPAVPVRHRVRLPRAVRADQPRGAAAARRRRGSPAGRGGRRRRHGTDVPGPGRGTQARPRRRADAGRTTPEGARGLRASPRGGRARCSSRPAASPSTARSRCSASQVDPDKAIIAVDGRIIGAAAALGISAAPQAGRRDVHRRATATPPGPCWT